VRDWPCWVGHASLLIQGPARPCSRGLAGLSCDDGDEARSAGVEAFGGREPAWRGFFFTHPHFCVLSAGLHEIVRADQYLRLQPVDFA